MSATHTCMSHMLQASVARADAVAVTVVKQETQLSLRIDRVSAAHYTGR